jgi:hypothetical protein
VGPKFGSSSISLQVTANAGAAATLSKFSDIRYFLHKGLDSRVVTLWRPDPFICSRSKAEHPALRPLLDARILAGTQTKACNKIEEEPNYRLTSLSFVSRRERIGVGIGVPLVRLVQALKILFDQQLYASL